MKDAVQTSSLPGGVRMRVAVREDVDALTRLINAAFQVERPFFDEDRVNSERVRGFLATGEFLLAEDSGALVGCVYLELRQERGYVGLLSVDPPRQGTGLGRKLMRAAEDYFRAKNCRGVDLRVISQRTPLPAFYRHLGYAETGTAPFRSDVRMKVPGHYILMSKELR
jgi:ribosomal protein S18 acetylase RimI-like enzyme